MPNVRRMRFATKGPAVMPQKILTDDAWTDALTGVVEKGAQAAQGGRAPHALQPPERDHRHHARRAMDKLFERGITVRNQTVLQRGVNDTRRDDEAAGEAPRPRQRAPVLRLRARPREGRRGPAHHAADRARHREGRARLDRRVQHADLRRRRARRRRQARRALLRALRPRAPASPCTPRRPCTPGEVYFYFDPLHLLPEADSARWADPAEQIRMVEEAQAAALAAPH